MIRRATGVNGIVWIFVSPGVARPSWPCIPMGWKPMPQNSVQSRVNGGRKILCAQGNGFLRPLSYLQERRLAPGTRGRAFGACHFTQAVVGTTVIL